MEVEFTSRGTAWRKKGRQPPRVPPALMQALQQTYEHGTQGNLPHGGASKREIGQVIRLLEQGAKNMDKHLRVQADDEAIRFWVEDKP